MCLAWVWDCFSSAILIRFLAADPAPKSRIRARNLSRMSGQHCCQHHRQCNHHLYPALSPNHRFPSWHGLAAELWKISHPHTRSHTHTRILIRTFRLRLPVTTKVHKFNADFGKRCDNVGFMCQVLSPENTPCPDIAGHISRPRLGPHLLLHPANPPNYTRPTRLREILCISVLAFVAGSLCELDGRVHGCRLHSGSGLNPEKFQLKDKNSSDINVFLFNRKYFQTMKFLEWRQAWVLKKCFSKT